MENKYFVDEYGREYVSWDMAQKELGISQIELQRLMPNTGNEYMFIHTFNGKTYFERSYFEQDIIGRYNFLKERNRLHEIQWKLPNKR